MTKLEKNIMVALEEAQCGNTKVRIEKCEDDNKSYFVKVSAKEVALFHGKEKVVKLPRDVYLALATEVFNEYIKF